MKNMYKFFLAFLSLSMFFIGSHLFTPQKAKAAVACSEGATTQNGIKVIPSHGSVFYIDSGITPKIDAGYIGYRVVNQSGSTQSTLWTNLSSFTGGVLSLSDPLDASMQLPSLVNNATGTSFFLIKATGGSSSVQKHTVRVYSDRPDLQGSTVLYECEYTFTNVQETIKAAANKLIDNGLNTSDPIEVSDTSLEIGQLLVISVEGETGQIGAGSAPDNDIVWLTPASISSWPTRKLRLESVSITFDGNQNWGSTGDQVTYNDQLLIKDVDGTNVDSSAYRVYYRFRVIGTPSSSVTVSPVAQISSGTQVKHTDTSGAGAVVNISFSSTPSSISLTKTITATTSLDIISCVGACVVPGAQVGMTYVAVPYRLTATTNSISTQALDEFIDIPETGVIFKPGSADVTDIGRLNSLIADPVYISSEVLLDPRPYHFIGPFNISSTSSAILDYVMYVPTGTYANSAYAKLGDTSIGANATQQSILNVTSTGSGSIEFSTSTESFDIAAITDPATNVSTTTAVINGTIDPNGASPLTAVFQYSTNSNLSGFTTVTATTPTGGTLDGLTDATSTSFSLSGLSPNTTYYYRVVAGSASGSILSFTTPAVLAPPTVTTTAATNVATTTSTINGTINPNLTNITGIQFIWGTSTTLTSGNTTTTIDDGSGAAQTISGASVQSFSTGLTGLTPGTTYYFRIRACTGALVGVYPNVECSSYTDGSILSFVTPTAPTVTTSPATSVDANSATLNGDITNTGGANATVRGFQYGATVAYGTTTTVAGSFGVISFNDPIVGLTPGTLYHFRAYATNPAGTSYGIDRTFTTSLLSRTLSIDPNSYTSSYLIAGTPPTIVAIPSAGTGTITYSSLNTAVCTINASTGVVTFITTGPCIISASITANGGYNAATASSITFIINSPGGTGGSVPSSSPRSSTPTSTPTPTTNVPTAVNNDAKNQLVENKPACDVCGRLSYDVYIINPNGTERRTGTPWVKVKKISNTVTRYSFEDASLDQKDVRFNHNDVVLEVDSSDCTKLKVTTNKSTASWKHKVRMRVRLDGVELPEISLSENSHEIFGRMITVDATQDVNFSEACKKPSNVCDICSRLSYDVYIINPDGTERHTGTPYVKTSLLRTGVTRYSFEDATLNTRDPRFNHKDVIVDLDATNCANLIATFGSTTASWRHKIRLAVYLDGKLLSDNLLAENSRTAANSTVSVDARQGADLNALCSEKTQKQAVSTSCVLARSITQNLALRSTGAEVKAVQDFLSCLGYYPSDVDRSSFYGTVTEDAVKQFQTANNLPALGTVGPLTRRVLNSYR